ncbi:MAG: aspartate kinase [Bdellovibrionales bacterium]|nr:aspartate kinase [Bdellovibrionales bacterium]
MKLIVQKYGGSSLKTPQDIRRVAEHVARTHRAGKSLIVVVSAMGTSTDELIQLAYQVSPKPNRRELDMLLTAGERISMALLSMALNDLNCPSISFTGSQAGVLTDTSHSNARIVELRPQRVQESLSQGKVVVLAGFQGVDPISKEVTTLGRGGSDTTAVAMAAHFKAERCEILKDVDGIYSADPKVIAQAHRYTRFPVAALEDACFWGAKVLHFRCVELARVQKVPLYVGSSVHPELGTMIVEEEISMYEKVAPLTVNSLNEVHHLAITCSSSAEGLSLLDAQLKAHQLAWPQLLATVFEDGQLRLMFSTSAEQVKALLQAVAKPPFKQLREPLVGVSLTCNGLYASHLPQHILSVLLKSGINPAKTISSGTSFSVFVKPTEKAQAIECLHQLIHSPG